MAVADPAGLGKGAEPPRRPALVDALQSIEGGVNAELEAIRSLLARAIAAVIAADAVAAELVAQQAKELDRSYAEIHDRLMALIALQTPVATDLRLAMALLHVNDRIARMSAQCADIATLCRAMRSGQRPSQGQLDCLRAMAALADEQIVQAAAVLGARDPEGSRRVREHDLEINRHNRRCFELAVREGTSGARRQAAFFVALMARALERIGDNAVDIAQQAAFVATGQLRG